MELIAAVDAPLPSPARTRQSICAPFRVGAIQDRWHPDPDEHRSSLADGVAAAAAAGAELVCLQELTLSPYFAALAGGPEVAGIEPESLEGGPTATFVADLARNHGVHVSASVYEADDTVTPLGYNTAICISPSGDLVARTRKLHIPHTEGYHEDHYFVGADDGFPVAGVLAAAGSAPAQVGFPTCWDQWFPEVARAYSLRGAEVIVYPTAIGSEPDHPDFDTQPLWQKVIVGNGIANGTFMVAVNRVGTERVGSDAPEITFYGSSFISDPYGRVLVQAPRDRPAAIVADLDLDARADWLELFPFLTTRRPDAYGPLTAEPAVAKSASGG